MESGEEVGASCFIRCVEIKRTSPDVSCGFHLSRSKWDPYPWISAVEDDSPANEAGVKNGDCLLEVNGEDIVGRRISDVAELVRSTDPLELMLWNAGVDSDCTPEVQYWLHDDRCKTFSVYILQSFAVALLFVKLYIHLSKFP